MDPVSPVSPSALSAAVSPYQWHCRLGHPSSSSLRSLVPVESADFNCESCELGKHHRTSFPSRVNTRSSAAFDLVHCDVWGPSRIESRGGFKYFLILVDDYSRMTWLYLLKQRSEVPTVLKSFYHEIKTQYSVDLRILHTDNALEFTQQSIASFCESYGIIHQTSCSHTSQQNGVAERKHRHVLDVARTLMSHMHVPKYIWSDVVLTACFLINRMPSSVLHGDTSFSYSSLHFWVYLFCS